MQEMMTKVKLILKLKLTFWFEESTCSLAMLSLRKPEFTRPDDGVRLYTLVALYPRVKKNKNGVT